MNLALLYHKTFFENKAYITIYGKRLPVYNLVCVVERYAPYGSPPIAGNFAIYTESLNRFSVEELINGIDLIFFTESLRVRIPKISTTHHIERFENNIIEFSFVAEEYQSETLC